MTYLGENDEDDLIVMGDLPRKYNEDDLVVMGDLTYPGENGEYGLIVMGDLSRWEWLIWSHCNRWPTLDAKGGDEDFMERKIGLEGEFTLIWSWK